MNYIEIILENIQKQYLYTIIKDVPKFHREDIISSHFYDSEHDRDVTFQYIGNLGSFFILPVRVIFYWKIKSIMENDSRRLPGRVARS